MQSAAQTKSTADLWREFFANWPRGFARKGVAVASFGETVQFCDFVMNDDFVVLERLAPDTHGARRIAIPFARIEAVKYVEPLKTEQFLDNGFVASQPGPPGNHASAARQPVAAS